MSQHQPIQVLAQSDQGRVRERQEDHCAAITFPNRQLALLVVADGMGGHAGGALASATAVETVVQTLQPYLATLQPPATLKLPEGETETVQEAPPTPSVARPTVKLAAPPAEPTPATLLQAVMQQAHQAIQQKKAQTENAALAEAGSTMTLALVIGRQLHLAHVGDSRAYLWRQSALRQLTHDHSGAALLVAAGMLAAHEVRGHAASSLLYRFLGGGEQEARPEISQFALEPDDLLLLCSDGFWGMTPEVETAALLTAETDLAMLATTLIDTANAHGGQDNISVVLARLV